MQKQSCMAVMLSFLLMIFCCFGCKEIYMIRASAATSSTSDTTLQKYADQVAALVNQERQAQGLSPLYVVPVINQAAAVRSEECVSVFDHKRPDGTSCGTVLDEYGISWMARGENIAYGQASPEAVMQAWMNSDGHRSNILSKNYSYIGVGVVRNGSTLYWTQLFIGGVTRSDGYLPQYEEPVETTTTTVTTQQPMLTDRFTISDVNMGYGDELTMTLSGTAYDELSVSFTRSGSNSATIYRVSLNKNGKGTIRYTAPASLSDLNVTIRSYSPVAASWTVVYYYNEDPTETTTTMATTTTTTTTVTNQMTTLPPITSFFGDMNGDGEISITDVVLLSQCVLGSVQLDVETDINGDGVLDSDDPLALLRLLL